MKHTWIVWAAMACVSAHITPFSTAALAQEYSLRDARYVTTSKNVDVLSYIVCLEAETNKQPRRTAIETALDNAAAACQSAAGQLPRDPREPSVDDLRLSILECGFRPEEASPDAGCDSRSGGGQPAVAATSPAAPPALPPRQTAQTTTPVPALAAAAETFPVWGGSRGGNLRARPDPNAVKVGSSGDGHMVELLEAGVGSHQGYPWFLVRKPDGTVGYMWGGGICSYPSAPRAGTASLCTGTDAGQTPTSGGTAHGPAKANGAKRQPAAAASDPYARMPDGSSVPNGLFQSCANDFGENSQPYFGCLDRGIAAITLDTIVSNDPLRYGNYSDIVRQDIEACMEKGRLGSNTFYACLGHTMALINQAKAQSGASNEPDPAQFGADGQEDDIGIQIGDYCAGRYPDPNPQSQCIATLSQCVDSTTGVDPTGIVTHCAIETSWEPAQCGPRAGTRTLSSER